MKEMSIPIYVFFILMITMSLLGFLGGIVFAIQGFEFSALTIDDFVDVSGWLLPIAIFFILMGFSEKPTKKVPGECCGDD